MLGNITRQSLSNFGDNELLLNIDQSIGGAVKHASTPARAISTFVCSSFCSRVTTRWRSGNQRNDFSFSSHSFTTPGTKVVEVTATDADDSSTANGELRYSLVQDQGAFQIDSITGASFNLLWQHL